ncbi:MAG: 16S rRNA (uracil(1498)-N(3))-methyltransferase [Schwartzia sp.]|nr:16S rRNA (uracil(1498)-N(3))-methyltransferase [Schwartzia sp. (in: firmicutes)]
MRKLFVDRIDEFLTLTGDDARHLGYSLRAKKGDKITAVDNSGEAAVMEITGFSRDTVALRLVSRESIEVESPIKICLAMCLPKSDKMDLIVQKATELGVREIQPLMSRNCVVRYDDKKRASRREKWQRVAAEASKQCGRTLIPTVNEIMSYDDFILSMVDDESAKYLFYEREHSPLNSRLYDESDVKSFVLIVGAEGGFTEGEVAAAREKNIKVAGLGPRVLRCETAAIAAVSIVQFVQGDL